MPQKCRVKHMCMHLLEQALGNKRLQGALPAAVLFVPPSQRLLAVGQDGSRSVRSLRKNPKLWEITQ